MADVALSRAEWQETVFAARPRRVAILELQSSWALRPVRVSILRNHAVEPAVAAMRPFLAYAGLAADVVLSDYDDSLSAPPTCEADAHVVWLDPSRYPAAYGNAAAQPLTARLVELRTQLRGPMLLVDAPAALRGADILNTAVQDAAAQLPDVYRFPHATLTAVLGDGAIESRIQAMGTHVSGESALLAAQHLGLQWIPAMIRPRLKAVVVDLDDTIVGGTLSEDGVLGIRTGGAYAAVRDRLMRLHDGGILLALVTRNDGGDVNALFSRRSELAPLRRALVAVEAGWHDKAASVTAVAERLHIALDTVLVMDDNAAEVAAMAAALRDPWFIVASSPETCERALTLHPGLLSLRADGLGPQRTADLQLGQRRISEARQATDPLEYLDSLRMEVHLRLNSPEDRNRLSELSRKTNQFNTSLARLSEQDVDLYLTSADRCVVSIRLRDRLSDSGLIGAVFARRQGAEIVIDEIALSCRALGRTIEDFVLSAVLERVAADLGGAPIVVAFASGPRNGIALRWLEGRGATCENAPGRRTYVAAPDRNGNEARHPAVAVVCDDHIAPRRVV